MMQSTSESEQKEHRSGLEKLFQEPALYILMCAATLVVVLWSLPLNSAIKLTSEGEFIEKITPWVLGLGGLATIFQFFRNPRLAWLAVMALITWTVLRELDFQKRFTPRSIESTRFYLRGDIPLKMKLATVLALAPFVCAGIFLVWKGWKHRKQLRELLLWERYLLLAFTFAAAALIAEKFQLDRANIIEEVGELAFACFIVFAVIAFPHPPPRKPKSSPLPAGELKPVAQLPPMS